MIGTTLNGRFRLDRELGRGGMGAVFRAIDSVLERPVAIKILKDVTGADISRRIRLEAQILARLLHENVVRLYDFSADGDTYYFIMEEVDGPSFARRWKKIAMADRLEVVAQTAEALDYAHHQGVIHRDVKPANILLTANDRAKLSDFGLSMRVDSDEDTGIVRGTPQYMSPEQAKGRKIDHRTDLYSLGVILYECATGKPPFLGPVMGVMSQHINVIPDPPRVRNPEISEEFEALILALLCKDPADRPESGVEVSARLRSLIEGGKVARAGESVSSSDEPTSRLTPGLSGRAERMIPASMAGEAVARSLGGPATMPTYAVVPRVVGTAKARVLIDAVVAEPISLEPHERYLHGHYLAYLLGGSRRRGFLLRRPLDPINADRARLLLAMTALTLEDGAGVDIAEAAAVLDDEADVRPLLSPVVMAKYLKARSSPSRRKRFRGLRQKLQQASERAARHLTDDQGVLNPGLMPQNLNDLHRLAPTRTEVDDELVERWNQVAEVWRTRPDFRQSVLRYATKSAWKDPASGSLWPEVVYPLIERARRQRQLRSNTEAVWDAVCGGLLHVGDAGVKMDRAIRVQVPPRVVRELDLSLYKIVDDAAIEHAKAEPEPPEEDGLRIGEDVAAEGLGVLDDETPTRGFVRFAHPDPIRQTLGDLRELWVEATRAMRAGASSTANLGAIPLGPYRLIVVPSVRSRSAGQLAIQGMSNKQVEILVPPLGGGGPLSKLLIAVWIHADHSLAITHFDNLNAQKYIVWDASAAKQTNFDDPAAFNSHLLAIGLEVPDQLDRSLTKSYQPRVV